MKVTEEMLIREKCSLLVLSSHHLPISFALAFQMFLKHILTAGSCHSRLHLPQMRFPQVSTTIIPSLPLSPPLSVIISMKVTIFTIVSHYNRYIQILTSLFHFGLSVSCSYFPQHFTFCNNQYIHIYILFLFTVTLLSASTHRMLYQRRNFYPKGLVHKRVPGQ